jgi:hypothetical protein
MYNKNTQTPKENKNKKLNFQAESPSSESYM